MIGDTHLDAASPDLGARRTKSSDPETRKRNRTIARRRAALLVGDLVVLAIAIGTSSVVTQTSIGWALISLACYAIAVRGSGLYRGRLITGLGDEFRRITAAVIAAGAATTVAGVAVEATPDRAWLALSAVLAWVLLVAGRGVWRRYYRVQRALGNVSRSVVLVGVNPEADMVAEMIESAPVLGYRLVDRVDPTIDDRGELLTTRVLSSLHRHEADTALVCGSGVEFDAFNRMCRDLRDAGINVELSMGLVDVSHRRLTLRPVGRFPVAYLEPVSRTGLKLVAKRGFDIVASVIGLVVLAPILVLSAIAIKTTTAGPVIFRQERVGKDGKRFTMLKFRTMVADAEDHLEQLRHESDVDGPLFKLRNDPRVTRVGRWLRRTSLDEVPQLVNVVKGDMSLVGPRPALHSEMAAWPPELYGRLRVRPGITGLWQVSGRSEIGFDEYTRLDLYYVDNWSLGGDLAILARTAAAVVRSAGAY